MTSPPLFLTEPGDLEHDRVVLSGPEGRHAAAVRRVAVGEVVKASRDTVVCAVRERSHEPPPRPGIAVVQALPKGDRGELAVELMTEAGVDIIVPWEAQRCVARWKGDRGLKSLRKWRDAARAAAKQARRARVPEVAELESLEGVAQRVRSAALGVVLHEGAEARLSQTAIPHDGAMVVVVGPEGGFTGGELAALADAGAVLAALGPSVLRTSTAGVASLAVIQALSGRW